MAERGLDWPPAVQLQKLPPSLTDYPANTTLCLHLHTCHSVGYTMSGFEVAGVVLAVLPLICKALESYSAGVRRLCSLTYSINSLTATS